MLVCTILSRYDSKDPVVDVSISVTGGVAVGVAGGAVVAAAGGAVVAAGVSATVTRLEPVSLGVVSFAFGPMMGLLEKLVKKP
tara:strand:+ start:604 stop:852 length:249 start_codon:yes stop_codon:yes gene_type:complete